MTEKERRAGYLRDMRANERHPRHGTKTGYGYGCRCDRCKAAAREYELKRQAKKQHEATRPQGFCYAFPAHVDSVGAECGSDFAETQVRKICEEVAELADAIRLGEGDERVLEECLDAYHACETLMRTWDPQKVEEARVAVVAKNEARGYYEEVK